MTLLLDDVRRDENYKLYTFVCFANSDKDTEINAFGEARKKSAGVGDMGK